jgi:hypothetical protein
MLARGIHGLPKVSAGPAMPDTSMPCGRAVRLFQGWPAHRMGDLWSSSTPLTPRRTPMDADISYDTTLIPVFVNPSTENLLKLSFQKFMNLEEDTMLNFSIRASMNASEVRSTIRRTLGGHDDTPCGWQTPGWPVGRPWDECRVFLPTIN